MSFILPCKKCLVLIFISFLFFNSIEASEKNQTKVVANESIKVASVQYPFNEGISEKRFFEITEELIAKAEHEGAQLVVLPELITTTTVPWSDKNYLKFLEKIPLTLTPKYFKWIERQAQMRKLYILGGSSPRWDGDKKGVYNTAIFSTPKGRSFFQDKIFLTPDEKQWEWLSGDSLQIITTPIGRIVIEVCFDIEYPVLSMALAGETPDLLLVPSWTSSLSGMNRVDWTARARAVEHYAYVIKASTVPSSTSTESHFGQGGIYGPQDEGFVTDPILGKFNQTQVVIAELDLDLLQKKRKKTDYYPGKIQALKKEKIKIVEVE